MEQATNTVYLKVRNAVVWTYLGVASWDVKGPFLVLTQADGTVHLVQVPADQQVEIAPDGVEQNEEGE